jgi:hypothetical protein
MNKEIAELIQKLQEVVSTEIAQSEQSLQETRTAVENLVDLLLQAKGQTQALRVPSISQPEPPLISQPEPEPPLDIESAIGVTGGHQPKRYLQVHTILDIARMLDTGFGPADVAEKARGMGIEEFSERHLGQTMAHLAKKKNHPPIQVICPGKGRRPAVYRYLPPT